MTNDSHTVLYTGVMNSIQRRVSEHRSGAGSMFTRKYRVKKLVYVETTHDIMAAITREKQIKSGSRQDKIDLINNANPEWRDISEDFLG